MSIKPQSYWQGRPLEALSREGVQQAAEAAIAQVMQFAEEEKQRQAFDLAAAAFMAGALLAGLGALFGVLLAH